MINLIWDMDGTIVDSYPEIMERCKKLLKHYNLEDKYSDDFVYSDIIHYSVGHFNRFVSTDNNIDYSDIVNVAKTFSPRVEGLELIKGIKEFLEWSNKSDLKIKNYVYTHRGKSYKDIFSNLGVLSYFDDCIDATMGFKAKPAPDGVLYLVDKYNMDKDNTYYIGDRIIDIECGKNAGIKSVFLNTSGFDDIDSSKADFVTKDILEFIEYLNK